MIKKSKKFIKAKLMVSKSCLLGLPVFMVFCLLGDALLNKTKDWALVNERRMCVCRWMGVLGNQMIWKTPFFNTATVE